MPIFTHTFKNGNTVEAYPENPTYGRAIVMQPVRELTDDKSGGKWLKKVKRVAFIKGPMKDLIEDYGTKPLGAVAEADFCIVKKESLTPFWTQDILDDDGNVTGIKKQEPKKRPAQYADDGVTVTRAEETVLHNGQPVYMQFQIAVNGTKDQLIADVEAVAAVVVDSEDSLIVA